MDRQISYVIQEEYTGKTVKDFLLSQGYSHPVLVQLKKTQNSIMRQDEWLYFHSKLHTGDTITIYIEETTQSENIVATNLPIHIVYEDADIIVINKAANMPIHPSMNNYDNSLANALMYYYRTEKSPFVYRCINRLDKDTSGLTVIAKNPLSAAILYRDMTKHRIKRTYYALVSGKTEETGTIDVGISRLSGSAILRFADEKAGERAITHYQTIHSGPDYSIVKCQLETGRTHQIRVHMSHIGHPLLGDYLYNPDNHELPHHALHGGQLDFIHPTEKKEMHFTAPLPDIFKPYISDEKEAVFF